MSILGYFVDDMIIKDYTHKYYYCIQNIFKYLSLFVFQNMVSKIFINNYEILTESNIIKINLLIFIYFLIDIILDVYIDDIEIKKEMYTYVTKVTVGYYIVEKIIKKKLEKKDYIYILVMGIVYYIYYTKINNIKKMLKNDHEK